jgi:hypothetical protein
MKRILPFLVAIFALGLSASAAYFSVLGLTKMFAGAVLGTAIVCSFIEGSKLIIASVLHQYSKQISWLTKSLLTIFLLLAMAITSMGVYGYLTNAFQSTANQLEVIDGKTKVLAMKRDRFQESLDAYVVEKQQLTESITELSKGLSNNVIEYKDKETGEIIRTTSSSTRRVLTTQLDDAKSQRDKISLKVEALTDSVTKLDITILELNSNEDLAAEIGPLKFITQLTGIEMNRIVNFLTMILVLIVDPLAIVLVIVFNNITKKNTEEKIQMSVPEGMEFDTPYPLPLSDDGNIPEEKEDDTDEWDEDHATDMVLNSMLEDFSEEELQEIVDDIEDDDIPEPNEQLTDASKRYRKLMKDTKTERLSEKYLTEEEKEKLREVMDSDPDTHIDKTEQQEFYGEQPKPPTTSRPNRFG